MLNTQSQAKAPATPPLVQLLSSTDEPGILADACQSESLKDFRHHDWFRELPFQAVELWRTFPMEARAAMLVMAEQLATVRNEDLRGADN